MWSTPTGPCYSHIENNRGVGQEYSGGVSEQRGCGGNDDIFHRGTIEYNDHWELRSK